jgi:histidinol-phosphatase (PHP family)
MSLPADSHVHTEWSWDAALGDMVRTCSRAVDIGLPAVAFTEHVDHTVWTLDRSHVDPDAHLLAFTSADGLVSPGLFDAAGYLDAVTACRERFPALRILTGVELGEPHLHAEAVRQVLSAGTFDRVLGSLHCLADGDGWTEPGELFGWRVASDIIRTYLLDLADMVAADDTFEVLAHIDYPVRSWPAPTEGRFPPEDFEAEFRHALEATAAAGKVLEINTVLPLHPTLVHWWHEAGGDAVSFGSDAHAPGALARRFQEASHLAEACGFRPGRNPHDLWGRIN